MAKNTGVSIPWFLFHVFMTCLTGGLWLIGMIIWYLIKK